MLIGTAAAARYQLFHECVFHVRLSRVNVWLQALMMRSETQLSDPWAKLLVLGLGLLFLGKQEAVEATIEVTISLHLNS